jgi:hypothetical protein
MLKEILDEWNRMKTEHENKDHMERNKNSIDDISNL